VIVLRDDPVVLSGEVDLEAQLASPVEVVDLDHRALGTAVVARAIDAGRIVIGVSAEPHRWRKVPDADVLLTPAPHAPAPWVSADVDASITAIDQLTRRVPSASLAFVELLRAGVGRSVGERIVAESVTYAMLQASGEFARWLAERRPRTHYPNRTPAVLAERHDGRLLITLNRPAVRNALDVAVRDAVHELVELVHLDPSITEVILQGAGPAFCCGGDVSEFGSMDDPALGHRVRMARSVALGLHRCADRLTVRVHGVVIGAGLEIAAFAHRVVADRSARFALPEIAMGLVPGAGGSASIPARIGRERAAYLALSNCSIDAATGFEWGLVDELVDDHPAGWASPRRNTSDRDARGHSVEHGATDGAGSSVATVAQGEGGGEQ
jgi:enoyl-CoA hydratase/carnithine racemase